MTLSAEILVEQHLDALYGMAKAWTLNEDLAQELTHRSFLKAFEKRGQLRNPDAARAWLAAILRNEIASEFRRRHLEVGWDAEQFEEIPDHKQDTFVHEEAIQILPSAFQCLNPAAKDILLLRFQQDLSYEDIGRILNLPLGTVMSRLHRAKAALKAQLETLSHAISAGTGGAR